MNGFDSAIGQFFVPFFTPFGLGETLAYSPSHAIQSSARVESLGKRTRSRGHNINTNSVADMHQFEFLDLDVVVVDD